MPGLLDVDQAQLVVIDNLRQLPNVGQGVTQATVAFLSLHLDFADVDFDFYYFSGNSVNTSTELVFQTAEAAHHYFGQAFETAHIFLPVAVGRAH